MTARARSISRSFVWLNATQFLGALNDNVFKLLVIFFVIATKGGAAASQAVFIGSTVFVVPFLLFSAAAGVLADRAAREFAVLDDGIRQIAAVAGVGVGYGLLGFAWAVLSTVFYWLRPPTVRKR